MLRPGAVLMLAVPYLLVAPAPAVDLIAPVSQDRSVTVFAVAVDNSVPESDQDSDSVAAPDFALFQASATANASIPNAVASSSAAQTSEILGSSMQATGSMSATAESYDYEALGQASATSGCEVAFVVIGPSSFTLSGDVAAFGSGAASVTLAGPSGTIVSVSAGTNQTTPVLETGDLDPDTYTLTVSATGSAYGDFFIFFDASATYDLLFELDPVTSIPAIGSDGGYVPVAVPNPFRDVCTIRHGAPGSSVVAASILDVRGRLVRELNRVDGRGTLVWDGRNRAGDVVRPGVYFVRLIDGSAVRHVKVTRVQ